MSEQTSRRTRLGCEGQAAKDATATAEAEVATEVLEDDDFVEEEYVPSEADGGMFGDIPAKKAKEFWPSAKRLMGLLKPEAVGVVHRDRPRHRLGGPQRDRPQGPGQRHGRHFRRCHGQADSPPGSARTSSWNVMRQQGQDNFADMVSKMELTRTGIDFPKLTFLISIVLLMYFVANIFLWAAGLRCSTGSSCG